MKQIAPPQAYDAIIWDWNGTLLDDLWLALEIANGMLSRRNLPTMDRDRYREIFDFPVSEYYRIAGFDFEAEPFSVLADEFIGEYNSRVGECRLQSAANQLLDGVETSGTRQVVLSASRESSLYDAVGHHGIVDRFETLQGLGDHFAVSKTDAGRQLVARLGASPRRTVMIGDTTHDFEVASEIGVTCILVGCGHQSMDRLAATGAPVFATLEDLGDAWLG